MISATLPLETQKRWRAYWYAKRPQIAAHGFHLVLSDRRAQIHYGLDAVAVFKPDQTPVDIDAEINKLIGKGESGMLVLSRRLSETLVIGDDVKITVLGINGNQVRLGIDAPKNVSVHREEVYQRIKGEQQHEEIMAATR